MKNRAKANLQKISLFILGLSLMISAPVQAASSSGDTESEDYRLLQEIIVAEFGGQVPHEWGEQVSGVKTRLKTDQKIIAIALDLCGLNRTDAGSELIRFFAREKIPATLFVCGDWIDQNREALQKFSQEGLFEIANQGLQDKPVSVNGRSVSGTKGTSSIEEVFKEIEKNARKIESITGMLPQFYHAGAGYYDEVAVRIAKALGYDVVNSGVRIPADKNISKRQILEAFQNPSAGAIAVLQASSLTAPFAAGVMEAVRALRSQGYKFARLSDYPLE